MGMNNRLLRPRASGFTPKSIANLAVWLDASDSTTLFQNSDGTTAATSPSDPVGYWADKSGAGRNATQSTANNRPTISTVAQNGLRGLAFDNSNDVLSLGNISAAFSSSEGTAIIAFGIATGGDNIYTIFRTRSNNSVTHENSGGQFSYDGAWRASRLAKTAISGMPYGAAGGTAIYSLRASSSQYNITVGGVSQINATASWSAGDAYQIGADAPGSTYTSGYMFEVILYARFLTDAERSSVEKYLGKKWGIAVA